MGLIGKSTVGKAVDGALDTVGKVTDMIDKRKYTAQEQAEFNLKTAEGAAEFVKSTYSESTIRSRTRRSIAVFYIIFFCAFFVGVVILYKFDEKWANFALGMAQTFQMEWAFITIIIFFFGGYVLREHLLGAKK